MKYLTLVLALIVSFSSLSQDHSVAREWNELHLNGIRNDFARPTITARNLWHVSAAMYDAWAVYDEVSENYFLGNTIAGFDIPFDGITIPTDAAAIEAAQEEAVSYAAYRMLSHRYANLPSTNEIAVLQAFDNLMATLGYDISITSTDYANGGPAELGNYIADRIIAFGLQDGSFEDDGYDNQYYEPIYDVPPFVPISQSEALVTNWPGNPTCKDPNRWQPLTLLIAIDQGGNPLPINTPEFLSPEWGNVVPFSFESEDLNTYQRDGHDWNVYCDPGPPPHLDSLTLETGLSDNYKWGNAMVVVWSSLLQHDNGVMIDISPNNIGNVPSYPTNFDDFDQFYDFFNGLDSSQGYDVNPATGLPYEEELVPLGDYGRVLAEFWADGPDSETPPGHWFDILNYVSDHQDLEKKWNGQGEVLDDLEWDVKTYLTMGAAMHDCAIAAWGIKGYYDYVRPISAIRYMGDQGQCSDQTLPNYDNSGLPLIPDYIELVEAGDPLVGNNNEHLNKIKVKSWRGPDYLDQINLQGNIIDGVQDSTIAGVDWILAENWWPYQRPTFVSPPFAGYVSGHSTYSRAAAEVLEQMTGDAYFPGGMGVFPCPQNNFLVFEDGPSVDLELQWAKYTDASDQCSLSRIFGGIHPPADDLPGRIIGEKIGTKVYEMITEFANPQNPKVESIALTSNIINEANATDAFSITAVFNDEMDMTSTPTLAFSQALSTLTLDNGSWTDAFTYVWNYTGADVDETALGLTISITGGMNLAEFPLTDFESEIVLDIDTEKPEINLAAIGSDLISEATVGSQVQLNVEFNEAMLPTAPNLSFGAENPTVNSLLLSALQSGWTSNTTYGVDYDVADANEEMENIAITLTNVTDMFGNPLATGSFDLNTILDTKAPEVSSSDVNTSLIAQASVGNGTFSITVELDEDINTSMIPEVTFPNEVPGAALVLDTDASGFTGPNTYQFVYDCADTDLELADIDYTVQGFADEVGNMGIATPNTDQFSIDTFEPSVTAAISNLAMVTQSEYGDGQLVLTITFNQEVNTDVAPTVEFINGDVSSILELQEGTFTDASTYEITYNVLETEIELADLAVQVTGFVDGSANAGNDFDDTNILDIDTQSPDLVTLDLSTGLVNESNVGTETFTITVNFDSELDTDATPSIVFTDTELMNSLTLNETASGYDDNQTYTFVFDVTDLDYELSAADFTIEGISDVNGNFISSDEVSDSFVFDTAAPEIASAVTSQAWVNEASVPAQFFIDVQLSEDADNSATPLLTFLTPDVENTLTLNSTDSEWLTDSEYRFVYDVTDVDAEIADIDFEISGVTDVAQNPATALQSEDVFSIDTKAPLIISSNTNANLITELVTGNDFIITTIFDEPMGGVLPTVEFSPGVPVSFTSPSNMWTATSTSEISYLIQDGDDEQMTEITLSGAQDAAGNEMEMFIITDDLYIDNKAPVADVSANVYDITETGTASFQITAVFDEDVQTNIEPTISFPVENPDVQLEINTDETGWNGTTYTFNFNVEDLSPLGYIDIELENVEDTLQNSNGNYVTPDFFSIMLDTFLVVNELTYNELKVYPNPARAGEEVNLELESASSYELKLTDGLGREIELPLIEMGANSVSLNSSGLSSGTYFLSVVKGNDKKAIRFEIIK